MNTSLVKSVANLVSTETTRKYAALMNNIGSTSHSGFWCYSADSESREDFEKRVYENWGDTCDIQIIATN